MALQDVSDRQEFSRIESGQREGSVGLVLVVALLLVAAAIGLVFIGRDQAATYILILLAALAVIGVSRRQGAASGAPVAAETERHHG